MGFLIGEYIRESGVPNGRRTAERMSESIPDARDVPPSERHPEIRAAFEELPSGGVLTLVNDHEPKPLFYEFQAEVESFDADGYEVERRRSNEFRARFTKR